MVMQSYDRSTSGDSTYSDVNGTITTQVVNKADGLWYITSHGGPPPYSEFKAHAYLKISMQKLSGWEIYRHIPPDSTWHQRGGVSPDLSPWYLWQIFDPMGADRGDAQTDAYNKAVADFNDSVRGNTDLSIDLAQTSKTLAIGRDCARVIKTLASYRNPLKIIKGIGEARLTWVYGIKPTFQSIYDAVHFTARHYNNEFAFSKGRGKSEVVKEKFDVGFQWPDSYYKNSWKGKTISRCEIGAVLRIPDTPQTQVARLSSLNPVSIAWELVPFSFVVDWFFNIGGYLRDLESALTYSSYFVRGYRTFTSKSEYYVSATKKLSGSTTVELGEWGFNIQRKQFDRAVLSGYPMPARPILKANLGSGRLLNAAALLSLGLATGGKSLKTGSAYQMAQRGVAGKARGFSGYYL